LTECKSPAGKSIGGLAVALDRSDVEHIAILARIGLTEAEVETFREQLSHLLEQFEVLRDLDTAGVDPTGHAVQLRAVMRDDIPGDSLDPEEVLSNAPQREGEFFRVKAVLEE
jgi:aspartyl-tRNA(Asn)/glutamyl-tRNA(Gln) amidotransferase subunit C